MAVTRPASPFWRFCNENSLLLVVTILVLLALGG